MTRDENRFIFLGSFAETHSKEEFEFLLETLAKLEASKKDSLPKKAKWYEFWKWIN